MKRIILAICILVFSLVLARLGYEIYYNYQLKYIYNQINIICKYLNINIKDIKTYIHNDFIRYEIIANSYKNMNEILPILEYNLKRSCMIEVDYNYCYIDIQHNSLYVTEDKVFNTSNALNFINGCNIPIAINLLQNICIQYNEDIIANNIIKYIQNITMHIKLLIYTTYIWSDCLQKIYELIVERMTIIWPYAASFKDYINYYNDLEPILIIIKLNDIIIPKYLLELMNKVGIFVILLSNAISNNFSVIIQQTKWLNRFKFQKNDYITYIKSNYI